MVGVFAQLCTAVLASDVPFEPQPGALSGLWPAPANASASGACLCLSEAAFKVSVKSTLSPPAVERLRRAIHRTEAKIFTPAARPHLHQSVAAYAASPTLTALAIYVTSDDLTLSRRTDESYALSIEGTPPAATLRAPSVYGALHGLETFSQLVLRGSGLGGPCSAVINASQLAISDAPRFRWRGLMLDSARHYLPVEAITAMLDAMSFNKLNVLHWHISDTQSFPLLTKATPALARGAYSPALVYTADDVRTIVGFAADRGIRVVPELDSPGHATSWSVGYPNATLPRCQTLDPTSDAAFALLEALFAEVASLFPDEYMHIGADEVDFACWNSSATVVSYMQRRGIARDDAGFKELTAKYIGRLTALVAKSGKTAVAWQEAMDHYGPTAANPTPPSARLPPDLVVEQWLQPAWNWANLSAITGQGYLGRPDATWPTGRSGFEALVTLGWYLDDTASLNAWEEAYAREPLTNKTCVYDAAGHEAACSCSCPSGPWRDGKCHCFDLRGSAKAAKVLGGEAPLWGEHIDHTNLEPRAFPRASAVAERLWSPVWRNNASAAAPRLLKHRCRMIERGVRVTPLGPGFC